jgi:hypothetical protein
MKIFSLTKKLERFFYIFVFSLRIWSEVCVKVGLPGDRGQEAELADNVFYPLCYEGDFLYDIIQSTF